MMVRSLAPVLAAVHCISYAAVVVSAESMSDDPFDEEPVTAAPVSDDPPELQAFQSYMGYMNKAVPMLAIVLFIMIYVFTTYINPEKKPPQGPKVHVSHILVEQEAEADAIRKEIKSASKKTLKFAELAAQKSDCVGFLARQYELSPIVAAIFPLHILSSRWPFRWLLVIETCRKLVPERFAI
jgi:hypothetical protein